jgi:DNA repair exonuclease SbcCD nuclease subunit
MKIIFSTVLSLSLVFAVGEPTWFATGELPQYSIRYNFVGVGEGTTFSAAQSAAQVAIAAQLEVTVASTIEMHTTAIETENSSYFRDTFKQSTESTINQSVKGIEVVKKQKSNGKYYVFAVLNKTQYMNSLKVELDQLWAKISSYVIDARGFTKEGRIFPALENYMDVQEFIPGFYTKKAFYDALSSIPFRISQDITMGNVLTEMRDILSGVKIEIESGNKQSALIGGPLPNPIVFNVYLKQKKNKITIPGMPLIIKYEDGKVVERVTTDEDGNIESYVTANPTGKKGGKVFARPNLTGLPAFYKGYLKNAEASATYKITDSPPIAFTLTVVDEGGTRLNKVEDKLTKSIEKMGYSVGPDAELALDGNVTIIDEKEVDGKSGRQYLVTAELDMFMVVKMNGEKVASFDAKGKGLSKKNIKDANKKAFQKLKLSKKNLAGMLSEADEELKRIFKKKSAEKLQEGKGLYAQGKLKKAIVPLTKVTHDEGQVEEAIQLIGDIKAEINRIESERLARIKEAKRKKREQEMALAQLAAETERARQQAELQKATTLATAQVSSAQIAADAELQKATTLATAQVSSAQIAADAEKTSAQALVDATKIAADAAKTTAQSNIDVANISAEADVLVAKYGVNEAEMNARAAEAAAQAEESKIAIEQVKKETEQVKLNQLKAQESIIVAEAEAEVAKTNAIAFAARLAEEQGKKTEPESAPLTNEENALVGDWNYLGTINPNTEDEDYSGAGSIFTIAGDRTFSDEGTTGSWSVNNESFLVNNSYPIPFIVDGTNLIMSVDVNGTQYLRIYEKY